MRWSRMQRRIFARAQEVAQRGFVSQQELRNRETGLITVRQRLSHLRQSHATAQSTIAQLHASIDQAEMAG